MAYWTYADWITYDDLTTRLERLRLHIVEVSQHVVGSSLRGRSVTPANQKYLTELRAEEKTLTGSISRPSIARNKAKFS